MGGPRLRWLLKLAPCLLIASCGGGGSGSTPTLLPDVVDHGGPVLAHAQLVPACTSEFGCGFCASSGKCEAMGGPASSAQSSCSDSSFATWPGSCKGFCAGHSASCADCASQPGCGWCNSGHPQCVEASHDTGQQASGSCPYADWNFTPDYCAQ